MGHAGDTLFPMERAHAWVDHTSEVELQVSAESLAGLAVEAGQALSLLLLRNRMAEPAGEARILAVESADREALLVDWLNEILFAAEVDLWVAVDFDILEISPTHLKASARGVPVEEPPSNVKAATFHGLQVEEDEDGWHADVIFDV
jgi:SHS2 domain-containing protein